jgi:hypothetical protein
MEIKLHIMKQRSSDFVLLLVIGALMVLAAVPASSPPEEEAAESAEVRLAEVRDAPPIGVAGAKDAKRIINEMAETVAGLDRRTRELNEAANLGSTPREKAEVPQAQTDAHHRLLPLVPGTTWVYTVTGPDRLVPSDTWTMRIVSAPRDGQAGRVEAGFGNRLKLFDIYEAGGGVRFEGLPFFEPIEFNGIPPRSYEGELLPHAARVVEGAVWTKSSKREILYKYTDKKGRPFEARAKATQRDRARASKFETVVVGAGRFGAHRVEWLSRVAIKTKGRSVLAYLTTEPYRREVMWLAPGIGIVSRNISYVSRGTDVESILFNLSEHTAAEERTPSGM